MLKNLLNWKLATVLFAVSLLFNAVEAQAEYATTILGEQDLFAYWRFDQDSGDVNSTAIDELGNNHGTYQGSATTITLPGEGAPIGDANNRAVDFTGLLSYIDVGVLPGFGTVLGAEDGGVTVEMWVKSTTGLADGDQVPFGNYSDSYNHMFINLDEHPDGNAVDNRIRTMSAWCAGGAGFDTAVTNDTWTYLAICLNCANADASERLKIYIAQPGETVTTEYTVNTTNAITAPNQSVRDTEFEISTFIGSLNLNGSAAIPFEGLIDEVALYTSALNKSQLDAHLAAATDVPEPASLVLLIGIGITLLFWKHRR